MESSRRRNPREIADELSMAKAAAWAWYQRGSGSEARPMSEYHLTRTHRPPKPSQFKLEAINTSQQEAIATEEGSRSSATPPPPPPSPPRRTEYNSDLLDTYEIERISKQLDYYIEASNVEDNSGFRGGGRRVASLPESDANGMMKDKKKSKRTKGFWVRHGVSCGSRDDVVEFARGLRPPPEKHVGVVVVGVANRRPRPRATHA